MTAALPDPEALLAFERRWWKRQANKDAAIRQELQLSPTRYYQLVNRAIDDPCAIAACPQAANRLRRIRDTKADARAARSRALTG